MSKMTNSSEQNKPFNKFVSFLINMGIGGVSIPLFYIFAYITAVYLGQARETAITIKDAPAMLIYILYVVIYYILIKKTVLKIKKNVDDIIPISLGFVLYFLLSSR